jgi:3-oxoacyl-[acyl-carrier protein] reductase
MTTVPELFSMNDDIALITGASRGIGAGIADLLGAAGATVVGTATSAQGAEQIRSRFSDAGVSGRGAVLDISNPESIQALLKDIAANEGAITVLVNNAGITGDNLLMRMKPEDWTAVIDTNLTSLFHLCRGCMRGMMKARRGRIVNIASVVAAMGNAGQTNYAAAKAGMIGFSKSLAREIASRNITVNVVAPGYIETDMTQALNESQRSATSDLIPLGRIGAADDIAAAVLYLASPAGAYVTGETIHVNGGMYMI